MQALEAKEAAMAALVAQHRSGFWAPSPPPAETDDDPLEVKRPAEMVAIWLLVSFLLAVCFGVPLAAHFVARAMA